MNTNVVFGVFQTFKAKQMNSFTTSKEQLTGPKIYKVYQSS